VFHVRYELGFYILEDSILQTGWLTVDKGRSSAMLNTMDSMLDIFLTVFKFFLEFQKWLRGPSYI
jgi:CDP-glycerol glycerophosphotransferase (TagB/SpsB family)